MKENRKKTKVMNYKTILLINLTSLIFGSLVAQNETEMRSFTKAFAVSKETSLEVNNKYGAIHMATWNKDSVSIRAEIKANAQSMSKLEKMFDGIDINITDTKYLIRAQTDFTQNLNMLFESFKGMTSKLISYDSRVEINYYISVPEYLNLRIDNKYGDVYMEDSRGQVMITVTNGSFKGNSLGNGSSVTLTFCDATINSISSGKINASFSDLVIGETGDLIISSISSRYEIKKISTLETESKRDKFFIDDIDVLKANSYFTDFKIGSLKKEIDLTTRYGNITTDLVENRFESININSGYSDISFRFDQGASYNFDIRQINSFLVLPDKDIKSEKKTMSDEKKEYSTFGTVGKNPGTSKVKIDATRGNIFLK
jgi:hypothetical protein